MKKSFFAIIAVSVSAIAIFSMWGYNQFMGNAVDEKFTISVNSEDIKNNNWDKIKDQIAPNIRHNWAFDFYAKYLNLSSTIKAGRYHFSPNTSVIRIVRMLKLGEQSAVNVTFNNVRTLPEFAGKVSSQLDIDSITLLKYLKRGDVAKRYGFNTTTIFSMFIPNTYQLYWNTSPEKFVERMHQEYNRFWTSERDAQAKRLNLSRVEVMTLASIIYEETKQTSEMARIAGVYANRLRIGMPLQADPTVKYAVGNFTLKRVLYKHLECDSPYNTYKHRGLPPSPIAMPSIAAIDAALSPERHSYIYFCARPTLDGYHTFAKTLSEHNINAAAYINAINRLKIK